MVWHFLACLCLWQWLRPYIFQNEHVSDRVTPEDRKRAEKRHCTSMWVMCPVSAIDHSPRNTQISNTYSYPLTAPENKGKIATKSLVKLNENLNWIDLCAFECGTGGWGRGGGCPRCEVLMNLPPNWLQASITEEWISLPTRDNFPFPKTTCLHPTLSLPPSLHLALPLFALKYWRLTQF